MSTCAEPTLPFQGSSESPDRITLDRLDKQIEWYDRRSKLNQLFYKALKTITMASAAAIPVLTTSGVRHGSGLAAALGVLIALLEGVQQLNQYQANWTTYRSTAEALKHEKYLFLGKAGLYLKADNAHALLAERVETLVSQENAKWFVGQSQMAAGDSAKEFREA